MKLNKEERQVLDEAISKFFIAIGCIIFVSGCLIVIFKL